MSRYLPFVLLLGFSASAFAGSIFDENYDNKKPAPPTPVKKEDPAPPPATPPVIPAQPDQPPAVIPARPEQAPPIIPAQPNQPTPELTKPAEVIPAAPPPPSNAQLAQEYNAKMDAAAKEAVEKDPDYLRAIASASKAKEAYASARKNGDPEEISRSFAAYNTQVSAEKRAKDEAVSRSVAYQDAKRLLDRLPKESTASSVSTPGEDEIRKKEIITAIKNRDLMEGMTLDEARRAARERGVVVSNQGNTLLLRWVVRARVGSHQVVTGQHASNGGGVRYDYEQVADYRTIAVINATFVDGKLTDFERSSSDSPDPVRRVGIKSR